MGPSRLNARAIIWGVSSKGGWGGSLLFPYLVGDSLVNHHFGVRLLRGPERAVSQQILVDNGHSLAGRILVVEHLASGAERLPRHFRVGMAVAVRI